MIVEQHIVPILKHYHGKNLTDFKDVDFQVYFPLKNKHENDSLLFKMQRR